ncbi:MAG: hypothetical protein M0C28_37705 [Candidatus Moduliflexus flocculans]|nr:hypothetical protein [Candidatus Moduliflexus flocculans]
MLMTIRGLQQAVSGNPGPRRGQLRHPQEHGPLHHRRERLRQVDHDQDPHRRPGADAGEILFEGRPFEPKTIREAMAEGVTALYQELNVVDDLTVEENLTLGRETCRFGMIRKSEAASGPRREPPEPRRLHRSVRPGRGPERRPAAGDRDRPGHLHGLQDAGHGRADGRPRARRRPGGCSR